MKINAYLKMKQNEERSLEHVVQTELQNCVQTRNRHTKRVPTHTEINKILRKCNLKGLNDLSSTLTLKEEEINFKKLLQELQNLNQIQTRKNQCKRARSERHKAFCLTTEQSLGTIANTTIRYGKINTHYEKTYLPERPTNNNPNWHVPRRCQKCTRMTKCTSLHMIFGCKQNKHARRHACESITTELEYYVQKYKLPATIQEILPLDTANMLLDAATTGELPQQQYQGMLSTLLGATLERDLLEYVTT